MAAADPSSSKSDLNRRLREIVRCPICLDDLRNPKLLSCLHSFCLQCLQQHWEAEKRGAKVECPVCWKRLLIPIAGLDALTDNFLLKDLIDARDASNMDLEKKFGELEENATEFEDLERSMCYENSLFVRNTNSVSTSLSL